VVSVTVQGVGAVVANGTVEEAAPPPALPSSIITINHFNSCLTEFVII